MYEVSISTNGIQIHMKSMIDIDYLFRSRSIVPSMIEAVKQVADKKVKSKVELFCFFFSEIWI